MIFGVRAKRGGTLEERQEIPAEYSVSIEEPGVRI